MKYIAKAERIEKWGKILGYFLTGQISVQFVGLIINFILLRFLSVSDYAKFSMAFAFQNTFILLVDLGFSGSIVALVGENKDDRRLVANYVRAAQILRARCSIIGIILSCIIFPILASRQNWSAEVTFGLLAAIIATVLFQSQMVYSAPLLIYGHLKSFYGAQLVSSVVRLSLIIFLYLCGFLTSVTATIIVTISTAINGLLVMKGASTLIEKSENNVTENISVMLRYLSPLIPVIAFGALQSQLVIALAAWFGKASNVAEVAALGRLAQFFLILGAFNSVIVHPYIASVSAEKLTLRYFQFLSGASSMAVLLTSLGFVFPNFFLWLLGANYKHLGPEISLSVAAAAINYAVGVLFTMNSARKWVFWWSTTSEIFVLLLINIMCVRFLDLSATRGLVIFSLFTAVSLLVVHGINGIYGLIFHRKSILGV